MISWILIIIVILVLAIIFIKFEHHAKRIKLIILILFIAFLYFSVSSVVHKNDVKLNSITGWVSAGSLYLGWLGNLGTEIWHAGGEVTGIVGNAIKSNSTNSEGNWKINIRK
jgi:Ca2+/Na+ antiporter